MFIRNNLFWMWCVASTCIRFMIDQLFCCCYGIEKGLKVYLTCVVVECVCVCVWSNITIKSWWAWYWNWLGVVHKVRVVPILGGDGSVSHLFWCCSVFGRELKLLLNGNITVKCHSNEEFKNKQYRSKPIFSLFISLRCSEKMFGIKIPAVANTEEIYYK